MTYEPTDLGPARRVAYVRNYFASGDETPRKPGDPAFVVIFTEPAIWRNGPGILRGATFMGDHFDVGFTAPNLHDGRFLTVMCAEVLVAKTADLTEAEFFSFVDSVHLHILLHILELDRGTPFEDHEAATLAAQRTYIDRDFALYERVITPEPWRSQ
jgi:hypothetical protein